MDAEVCCGYCSEPLNGKSLNQHLMEACPDRPLWMPGVGPLNPIGLEREGWDVPPEAA